ncbi:MAG: F0F1 ATP synthase subunit B [Bacteroidales bacterium]|jgi:F-type H+-transporting ATPase subunit b|nr:F0F1 ATP synthase subunit B [Bacteroidales bacterium]
MSLITPDFGLLFWMTLIFGIVFFILAKFGFPVLTDMVRKRQERIEKSLEDAREIEARMATWKVEQAKMVEETRKQQALILKEATETKAQIVADAKAQAKAEADKLLAEAKTQIAAEKESALRDVRKEIALLSVQVAEKVLRNELSEEGSQRALIDKLVDEASEAQIRS